MNDNQFHIGEETKAFVKLVDQQIENESDLIESGINKYVDSIFVQQEEDAVTVLDRYNALVKEKLRDFQTASERNTLIYDAIVRNVLAFQTEQNGSNIDYEKYKFDKQYRQKVNEIAKKTSIQIGDEDTSYLGDFLTRNSRTKALRLRKHIFAMAFVFNLTFDQMRRYMMHTCGQCDINYRNPYELLVVYSISLHEGNSYEHYLRLCKKYEAAYAERVNNGTLFVDHQATTKTFKARMAECLPNLEKPSLSADEVETGFIDFLCSLPCENKKSPGKVVGKLLANYVRLRKKLNEFELDEETFCETMNFAHANGKYKIIKEKACFPDVEGLGNLLNFEKITALVEGNFDFSQVSFTKENLLTILFYRFVTTGERDVVWASYWKKSDKEKENGTILKAIRDAFANYTLNFLTAAGFDQLYIVNYYERFLVYCLMTKDPIKTFREAVPNEQPSKNKSK